MKVIYIILKEVKSNHKLSILYIMKNEVYINLINSSSKSKDVFYINKIIIIHPKKYKWDSYISFSLIRGLKFKP